MSRRWSLLVAPALLLALLAPSAPAQAGGWGTWPDTTPSPSSFVTVVGDDDDFVTDGSDQIFRPGDGGQIHVFRNLGGDAEVDVVDPEGLTHFELTFSPPPGQDLTPGEYDNALRAPFKREGHPGIDVTGNGNGCNDTEGRFSVLDAPDDLSRLWIVYHASCGGPDDTGVSGEIKYNEPDGGSPLVVAPDRIDWTTYYPGSTAARTTPVNLINTGTTPLVVGRAEITSGGEDFSVDQNGCQVIAPGGLCALSARFSPSTAGPLTGLLSVPDPARGENRTVTLRGTGEAGNRTFDVVAQAGNGAAASPSYSYTGRDSGTVLHGDASRFTADVFGDNGDWWEMSAEAPPGETFTAGSTYELGPVNRPQEPHHAVFVASVRPYGCWVVRGRLTIDQLVLTDDGHVGGVAFTFAQYCDGHDAGLSGSYAAAAPRPASTVPVLPPAPPPPPPTPPAPDASDLSFSSVPSVPMTYGTTRTLHGTAHDHETGAPLADARVTLQMQSGSPQWHTVGEVTTDSAGGFRTTVRNARRSSYRAVLPTTTRYGGVTSIIVPVEVTPAVGVAGRAARRTFSLTARVHPMIAGQHVLLERYLGGRWRLVNNHALNRWGTTVFRVHRTRRALYRVVSVPSHQYGGRASRTVRVS